MQWNIPRYLLTCALLGGVVLVVAVLPRPVPQQYTEKHDAVPAVSAPALAASTPLPATSISLDKTCVGENAARFDCYKAYYRTLVETSGVKIAFADLKKEYQAIPYVRAQCHPLTHVIGQAAGKKAASVSEAFLAGDSFCWSGYYHGVMEAVVAKVGREHVASELDGICAKISGRERYSFDYYNCVHGLGHGLMEITQDELFDSLALCDHLTGLWEEQSCWGGVFMENIIVDATGRHTNYLKPDDPVYPCSAVEEKYKERCYMMQTSYMMKTTGSNFITIFALCRVADPHYRDICYQSLGRDASGSTTSDPERTKNICLLGADANERANCISGAVRDFVSYHHSDMQARGLCTILPAEFQKDCLSTVSAYYVSFKK